jgi:hypothetical protein
MIYDSGVFIPALAVYTAFYELRASVWCVGCVEVH